LCALQELARLRVRPPTTPIDGLRPSSHVTTIVIVKFSETLESIFSSSLTGAAGLRVAVHAKATRATHAF